MSTSPITVKDEDLGKIQWDVPQGVHDRLAVMPESERAALLEQAQSLVRHSVVLVAVALSAPDPKADIKKLTDVIAGALNEMNEFADAQG